nr:hypothetical protein [Tanacetum cinerariifolium]
MVSDPDQQNPTLAKIPILDTGKFEQWQFRIQQYLQHERYALWEVIEFGDSYEVPANAAPTGTTNDETGKKNGRTVTVTADDMQKRKNDVKARTTLLLSLPDEHQLRFSKYKTAQELWAAILKTFGGNKATKKTKKNILKHQYGNFKAEGSETLEQTFNRLQVTVSQLQFMDVEIKQDDLNQKFLTSLAPEWLMHTIVWRNRSDLDTMSLDDLYNHLKVYESEVQKKSVSNSQNMAFISLAKHSSRNEEVNIASVSTASTNVPTVSANIGVVSISQDTACAYIASQSSGSQIKFEDINQIDEDDMEEMDIKWNMALLSMRADRFWKKTGKKISIQGIDVARFDMPKVECFNCHKMGHFVREYRAPRSQDIRRRDNYRQGSKVEEHAPKALMAIDGVGWDWSYMANDEENHALVADEEAPTEFALMAKTSAESEVFDNSLCSKDCKKNINSLNSKITGLTNKLFDAKNMIYHYKLRLAQVESRLAEHRDREIKYCEKIRGLKFKTESSADYIEILKKELELIKKEKEGLDRKLAGFQTASKDLDSLLESQRLDKNKEGLGYSDVPPPPAQVYSPPKKDLSWTRLLEFADDTVSDYSRPVPTVESSPDDAQNRNLSVTENEASPSIISPKSFIKFVKANDTVQLKVRQIKLRKLRNLLLGPNFVMKKNACLNCDDFNHFAYDCSKRVKKGTSRSQNTTHKSFTPKPAVHKPYRPPMRPIRSNMNGARPNRTSFNKPGHSYTNRPFQRTSVVRSQYRVPWVPTVNRNFPLSIENFPLTKFSTADMGKKENAVKASACWFWKPSQNLSNKGPNSNSVSVMFKKYTYIDTQGNISYLSDYESFDRGYASFGQGGCKITGKGTIKQICDNKNSVLFTDSECIVLGQNFKLSDDDNVLLRTPRQHNMYSIDLNNIITHKDLTCLVAKASADELDAGTNSTNLSGSKDAASQEVNKDVSSLRYIALPNWVHDAFLESSSMETPIPTVSSPVPTACFTDSPKPSSDTRLNSKRVANQVETPSLDNILTLTNRFEYILGVTTNSDESNGVEADVRNMETTITASPTPTLRIHKGHPKSGVAEVPTGSSFIPTAGLPAAEVPTGSDVVPTTELPIERRIELISDLVSYQDNYAKVHKYQTQQRKPWFKKQKRDYYMAVIKSNLGWKVKDFRGMTFEEIEAKFTTESVKKLKTSEEVPKEVKSPDEVLEEKVKEMMQLVPIKEVYVEALQVKHPIIDWKVHTEGQRSYWKITRLGGRSASYQFFVDMLKHLDREDLNQLWALVKESLSIRPPTSDKEMELWVKLKMLYEPDDEDQLWTHTQNLIHAPVEWKLKGLAIGMISYKLQVENYSKMANDLILKIYKIASSPRQQGRIVGNKMQKAFPLPVIEFPLPEEVPTVSEESSHCQKKR